MKSASEFIFTNFEASNILNDSQSRKYIIRKLCNKVYSNLCSVPKDGIFAYSFLYGDYPDINHNITLISSDGTKYEISINKNVSTNLKKEIIDNNYTINKHKVIEESVDQIEAEIVSILSPQTKKR